MKTLQPAAVLAGVLSLWLATSAVAASALSDLEKKETVYRMYAEGKKDFPAVAELSVQQAMELHERKRLVFVDTRRPAEMEVSMLPGAISKEQYLVHPGRYKDLTVVAYCTIGYRSGVFARDMEKRGFAVYNLKGGILAWTLEGGSVYDAQGRRIRKVHVFGKRWDYAPAGYQTVKFSLGEQLF